MRELEASVLHKSLHGFDQLELKWIWSLHKLFDAIKVWLLLLHFLLQIRHDSDEWSQQLRQGSRSSGAHLTESLEFVSEVNSEDRSQHKKHKLHRSINMDCIFVQKYLGGPFRDHLQNSAQIDNQIKVKPDSALHRRRQIAICFHFFFDV